MTPAPVQDGQLLRPATASRLSWLHALPLLVRPIALTMPWVTLITGCLVGTGYLAFLAHVGDSSRSPLGQGTVRLAFLPAVAALAFVTRAPFRPLTQTTPVPAWVAQAGHLLLATPVLAATCWAQLRIMGGTIPAHTLESPPAVYPLIAQLTGWCVVTVAVAACVDRSRYADLGGAVAVPVSFAAIALTWFAPVTARFLTQPAATARGVTITWYAVASAALALTGMAMRDQWRRYSRSRLRRP
jgi:hypothetical protein